MTTMVYFERLRIPFETQFFYCTSFFKEKSADQKKWEIHKILLVIFKSLNLLSFLYWQQSADSLSSFGLGSWLQTRWNKNSCSNTTHIQQFWVTNQTEIYCCWPSKIEWHLIVMTDRAKVRPPSALKASSHSFYLMIRCSSGHPG